MLHGRVQCRSVPAAEGFQEGSRRLRALPQCHAAIGRLQGRASIPARSRTAPSRSASKSGIDIEDATWDKLKTSSRPSTSSRPNLRLSTMSDRTAAQTNMNNEQEKGMTRQMVMVGFLQAQNCTNLPSSWRHPLSRDDATSADYYQEIAPHSRSRQIPHRLLRRPPRHAGSARQRSRAHGRIWHPLRENGPDRRADDDGRGDDQARPRLHRLDHLLRAVRRGAQLPDRST